MKTLQFILCFIFVFQSNLLAKTDILSSLNKSEKLYYEGLKTENEKNSFLQAKIYS